MVTCSFWSFLVWCASAMRSKRGSLVASMRNILPSQLIFLWAMYWEIVFTFNLSIISVLLLWWSRIAMRHASFQVCCRLRVCPSPITHASELNNSTGRMRRFISFPFISGFRFFSFNIFFMVKITLSAFFLLVSTSSLKSTFQCIIEPRYFV